MKRPSIAVPASLGAACIALAFFPLWSRSREATRLAADLAHLTAAPPTVRNLAVGERQDRLQDAVGDPTLFVSSAYPGLWGHARELGGII